jgi:hypothetical protein
MEQCPCLIRASELLERRAEIERLRDRLVSEAAA